MSGPDWAINEEGKSLPYSPEQVRRLIQQAMESGTLLAVVLRMEDGNIAVPVIGDPSMEVAETLMKVGLAYKRALEGQ